MLRLTMHGGRFPIGQGSGEEARMGMEGACLGRRG